MEVGEKIVVKDLQIGTRRIVDIKDTLGWLRRNAYKYMCWGATAFTIDKDNAGEIYMIRFYVTGMKHKGHVYITVAYNDTFTIYYTSAKGTIKHIHEGIYCDMLCDVIDNHIEKQANYSF